MPDGSSTTQRPAVVAAIIERAAETPDGIWLKYGADSYTWAELRDRTFSLAHGLLDRGLRPGERVALMLKNSPDHLVANYAATSLGAATVPVNTAQRGAPLEHILRDSGARTVIVEEELVDAVEGVAASASIRVVVRGRSQTHASLDALFATDTSEPVVTNQLQSGLGILYTSGTTGPPKGVVADRYDLTGLDVIVDSLGVRPGETVYCCLPLFHGNALILSAMSALRRGYTLALAERFSASRFWADVARYEAVEFNALGAMIPILLKQPPSAADRDHQVRSVLSAACPAYAWTDFEDRFGVRLVEFYGMVDAPCYLLNDRSKVGSMGWPVPGVQFRVVGADGHELPVGEVGELVFRHDAGRLTHYHGDEEATERSYRDGWFLTGDTAEQGPEGDFSYRGRIKASIRRRGENVSAWEIETSVNQRDDVLECVAHAVDSPLGEDEVKLIVVPAPGAQVDPAELHAWCAGRMAKYAVPRYIEFRSELPKTATHRVAFAQLREEGIPAGTWDADAATAQE